VYEKVKENQVPKRRRKVVARFESTEEWRLMKADIDKGLKPREALQVILTDEDKKKYKIKNRRTVARFIQKYLDSKGLKYGVKCFGRDNGDFIIVQHSPLSRKSA
jgi:hypothetical protein